VARRTRRQGIRQRRIVSRRSPVVEEIQVSSEPNLRLVHKIATTQDPATSLGTTRVGAVTRRPGPQGGPKTATSPLPDVEAASPLMHFAMSPIRRMASRSIY
jgi:hypothetical protein